MCVTALNLWQLRPEAKDISILPDTVLRMEGEAGSGGAISNEFPGNPKGPRSSLLWTSALARRYHWGLMTTLW